MRFVAVIGTDMYGNRVEEELDLDETFEEILFKVCGRHIPVTYINAGDIVSVEYKEWKE